MHIVYETFNNFPFLLFRLFRLNHKYQMKIDFSPHSIIYFIFDIFRFITPTHYFQARKTIELTNRSQIDDTTKFTTIRSSMKIE